MNRNAGLFVVMCLVWGLTWWPVKVGAAHVPPIFLAAARFLLAGALMLAWAGRDAFTVPSSARARLLATALLVNTGNYALLFWGIARAPTGLAAIVNFATIPVFSLLASHWLEGEPIARRQVAAIARHPGTRAAVRHAGDGRAGHDAGVARRAVGAGRDRARHLALRLRRRAVAPDRHDDAGPHARGLADADRRHRPRRLVAGAAQGPAPAHS